uniref:Calpain catalytic domain-containing protein n=1 Tax=Mesocestoides corti TaxID=53468 RepID=A0A5K3FQB4_MESCO
MDTWASLRKDKTAVGAARCCENGLGDGEYDAMELFENIVSNILDESPEVPDQVEMKKGPEEAVPISLEQGYGVRSGSFTTANMGTATNNSSKTTFDAVAGVMS